MTDKNNDDNKDKSVDETRVNQHELVENKTKHLNVTTEDLPVIAELKNIAQSHKTMESAVTDLSNRLPFEHETNLQIAETMMKHIANTQNDIHLLLQTEHDHDDDEEDQQEIKESELSGFESLGTRMDEISQQIQSNTMSVNALSEEIKCLVKMMKQNQIRNDERFNELEQKNNGNKELSNEEKEVKEWMEETVKLPQYVDILINNGYDDIESVADVTMEELEKMGIDKMGHRKKIFKNAQRLNGSNTEKQINERNYNMYDAYSLCEAWVCWNCNTENMALSGLCKVCGMRKYNRYKNVKSNVEDPKPYDTAK